MVDFADAIDTGLQPPVAYGMIDLKYAKMITILLGRIGWHRDIDSLYLGTIAFVIHIFHRKRR